MAHMSIVRDFLVVWNKYDQFKYTRDDINHGLCYQYAAALYRKYKMGKIMACDCHVWIEYNGKNYDSDFPNGTTSDVCLNDCEETFELQNLRDLYEHTKYWRSGPLKLKVIKEVVKRNNHGLSKNKRTAVST